MLYSLKPLIFKVEKSFKLPFISVSILVKSLLISFANPKSEFLSQGKYNHIASVRYY